jgi:hypothetical protein
MNILDRLDRYINKLILSLHYIPRPYEGWGFFYNHLEWGMNRYVKELLNKHLNDRSLVDF